MFVLHALCLLFKCIQSQRLFPPVLVTFVEMGHVSMELAVMEWYSVLMPVMKSDANGNHTVTVLLPNFDAPIPTTTIPSASHLVNDVMEHQIAQMEVMNKIVGLIVTLAEGTAIATLTAVQRDVMVEPSATMEAMSKTVRPIVTTAEDTTIAPLSLAHNDVMEDQSAMMEVMNKIVDQQPAVTTAYHITTVPC